MKQQIIDFLLSMNWLWLIVLIMVSYVIKKTFLYLYLKIKLKDISLTKEMTYDEKEIISHIDYLINEAIEEYLLLHINPNEVHYINSKTEEKILDYIKEEIPKRISDVLVAKLGLIYNENYIGEFIGKRAYLSVTNYVIEFNIDNKK